MKATALLAGVLFAVASLAGITPLASAQSQNLALTASATASSSWQDDRTPHNTNFVAAMANDGSMITRWNARDGDVNGAWLQLTWTNPVTFNKVEIDESFNRLRRFELQVPQGVDEWRTVYNSEGTTLNPTGAPAPLHAVTFAQPVTTSALRLLIVETAGVSSITELRVKNVPLGAISGKVTDSSNAPIEGALVSGGGANALTDAQGNYSLTVEAAPTNLTASKAGFRSRSALNVNVPANGTATQNFSLLALPPNLLLTATAESSSDYSGSYDAPKANDGLLTTRWNSAGGQVNDQWLNFTWEAEQEFNTVVVREHLGRITELTVQRFNEATSEFVDIANRKLTGSGDRVITFPLSTSVKTKQLRIYINTASNLPTIYEVEARKEPQGTISGVVKDVTTGNPVSGAAIQLTPGGQIATTNEQGTFTTAIGPDEYLIRATAPNYFESEAQVVAVNANQTASVTLNLPAQGPNLALGGTPAASSQRADTDPVTNLNDGDPATTWRSGFSEEDGTTPLVNNQWVQLTFDQAKTFNVVNFVNFGAYPVIQSLKLLTMDASGAWVDVPNTEINPEALFVAGQPSRIVLPQPLTTKGVRVFISHTNGATSIPTIGELQLFNAPIGGGPGGGCKGNVNGDKEININDAVGVLRHIVSGGDVALGALSGQSLANADVDGQGGVNVQDAVLLLQAIVKLPPGSTTITNLTCP
ncbi:MAG: discoidin domain-containing protein [Armatimonadetes bacterium]|nr:discoidin domain-containing protein [Armatimonadota bacterium]